MRCSTTFAAVGGLLLVGLIALVGPAQPPSEPDLPAQPPSEPARPQHADERDARDRAAADRAAADEITEITLERTPCFGFCPVYTVTLRRDGHGRYEGKQNVEREGVWVTDDENPMLFNQLAQLAQAIRFRDFQQKYAAPVTDLPSAITTVRFGDQTKRVINYGNRAPIELWGLEMAIDGVVSKLKWKKADGGEAAETED